MIRSVALACLCLIWPSANGEGTLLMGKGLGFFDTKAEALKEVPKGSVGGGAGYYEIHPDVQEVKVND